MRQKSHFLFPVVAMLMLISFIGCNNNAFDFSQLDEIDSNGDWGFPLLNAEYTIGDILDLSDDVGFISQGSDGTVELRYEYTFDSIISASKYLDSYFQKDIAVEGSKTFSSVELPPIQGNVQLLYSDTLLAQFPADEILLESAILNSGQIELQINYNIMQTTRIVVTCPQLVSASGQPFHVEAQSNGGTYVTTINLDGYTLTVPADNEIKILIEVSCDANTVSIPNELSFSYRAAFQQD